MLIVLIVTSIVPIVTLIVTSILFVWVSNQTCYIRDVLVVVMVNNLYHIPNSWFHKLFWRKMNHSHGNILVQCQCVITIISIFKYSSTATFSGVTCQITTVFTYHSTCRFLKYSAEHFSVATCRALIWVYTSGKSWEEPSETCAKKKIKVSLGKLRRL